MAKMNVENFFLWLLVIGGVNWAIVAFANGYNLVEVVGAMLGSFAQTFEAIVYGLVGISAIGTALYQFKILKR